jgi:hypothetical protein
MRPVRANGNSTSYPPKRNVPPLFFRAVCAKRRRSILVSPCSLQNCFTEIPLALVALRFVRPTRRFWGWPPSPRCWLVSVMTQLCGTCRPVRKRGSSDVYVIHTQKPCLSAGPCDIPGNFLRSHTLARAVPSGLRGLTSVFGMGTGGSPSLRSPRVGARA